MKKQSAPPPTMIVALDIGYGVTKVLCPDKDPITFPSVCGHARSIKFRPEDLVEKYPGDQMTDEDGDWFVGDLALSQVPTGELLRLRGRTARNDALGMAYRVRMTRAALGKLLAGRRGGDVVHVSIATGLPVDHMPQAGALKEALIGQHPIRTDSAEFVANITDVMVMPQPYGTIYAAMLLPGGELNTAHIATRTGVVDVGTYTIDLALDDDGEFIDERSGSIEGGLYTAQQRIEALLEQNYGEKPSYRDVEKVLRTGLYKAYGRAESYQQDVEEALEPLRSSTLNLIAAKWKTGASIDVIYLSGGGAELVQAVVSAAYPQTVVAPHPQIANARGYLSYALFAACHA